MENFTCRQSENYVLELGMFEKRAVLIFNWRDDGRQKSLAISVENGFMSWNRIFHVKCFSVSNSNKIIHCGRSICLRTLL